MLRSIGVFGLAAILEQLMNHSLLFNLISKRGWQRSWPHPRLMNRSLLNLISKVGTASLDELRARGPTDETALARDVAAMVGEGLVALSPNPDLPFANIVNALNLEPADRDLISRLIETDEVDQSRLSTGREDHLIKAITAILRSPEGAYSVMISLTSRGFRRALA